MTSPFEGLRVGGKERGAEGQLSLGQEVVLSFYICTSAMRGDDKSTEP